MPYAHTAHTTPKQVPLTPQHWQPTDSAYLTHGGVLYGATHPPTGLYMGTVETPPIAVTDNALKHPAGEAFQAGFNEWFVESGNPSNSTNGQEGYQVRRQPIIDLYNEAGQPLPPDTFSINVNPLRWVCDCAHFRTRLQNTDEPYCKHIRAAYTQATSVTPNNPSPFITASNWVTLNELWEVACYFAEILASPEAQHMQFDVYTLVEAVTAMPSLAAHLYKFDISTLEGYADI